MRKACVPYLTVVVIVAMFVGGCKIVNGDADAYHNTNKEVKKDKNHSVPQEVLIDKPWVGEDVDAPYGWIQAGRKMLKEGTIDKSIFYTKEALCKDALRRIDTSKGTGIISDLNFYNEYCR